MFLYAQSLESDYSIWRYVDSLRGNADLAVSGVRMLRNRKTPTPAMKSAYRLCSTYYKLKELIPGSPVHASLSVGLSLNKEREKKSESEDRQWDDAMSKIAEAIGKGNSTRTSPPARADREYFPPRREVKRETRSPSIEILDARSDARERPRTDNILSSISKDSLQKLLDSAKGASSHMGRQDPISSRDAIRGWSDGDRSRTSPQVYPSASSIGPPSSFEPSPHVSSSAWSSATAAPAWSATATASVAPTEQTQSRPVYELASLRGATAGQPGDDPAEQYRRFIRMQEEEHKWRQEESRREAMARQQEEHMRRMQEFESSARLREMRDPRREQQQQPPSFSYDNRLALSSTATEPTRRSSPSPVRSDLSARDADPGPSPESLAQWLGLHDFVLDLLLRQHPSVRESHLLATAAAVRRAMALTGLRLQTLLSWMARSGADFVTRVIRGKLSNCLKGSLPAEDAAKLVVEYLEQKSRK